MIAVKHIFIWLFLSLNLIANGQNSLDSNICRPFQDSTDGIIYYNYVEIEPEFPGGEAELFEYIQENLDIRLNEENPSGSIYVEFIVQVDGSITNVHVRKAFDVEAGEQFAEIIRNMPKWTVGYCSGKPVPVKYTLPLTIN